MTFLLLSDIFGKTPALEAILGNVPITNQRKVIVDPYQGKTLKFQNESAAYDYFMEHVGLQGYAELIRSQVLDTRGPVNVLGFSVGGSALFSLAKRIPQGKIQKAVLFYASQIRHMKDMTPNFEMDLFFARQEPHFDVDTLMEVMAQKSLVRCFKTKHLHGFMNEKSKNKSKKGQAQYIKELDTLFKTPNPANPDISKDNM